MYARKGQLVELVFDTAAGPYVVIRGPYEHIMPAHSGDKKLLYVKRCVDLLDNSGKIVKHVECKNLRKVQ